MSSGKEKRAPVACVGSDSRGTALVGKVGFKHKAQPQGHPIGTGGRSEHHKNTSFGGFGASGHRVGSRRK